MCTVFSFINFLSLAVPLGLGLIGLGSGLLFVFGNGASMERQGSISQDLFGVISMVEVITSIVVAHVAVIRTVGSRSVVVSLAAASACISRVEP